MSKLVEREPAPGRRSLGAAPALAVQFFLIPLAVVGLIVIVYGGFRLLLSHERPPDELLHDIRTGGETRRGPAAVALSRIMLDPDVEQRYPGLSDALVQTFEDYTGSDPDVPQYLALAIGRLADPPDRSAAVLVEGLTNEDTETQISVLWALAMLGDTAVSAEMADMYGSEDAGVRKMTVYALGAMPDATGRATLLQALDDPVPDVQWNAAVALARHGFPEGEHVLARMLDREYVERSVTRAVALDAATDPVAEVIVSGLQAVEALGSTRLHATVAELSRTDDSLRVRERAMRTLAAIGTAEPAADGPRREARRNAP